MQAPGQFTRQSILRAYSLRHTSAIYVPESEALSFFKQNNEGDATFLCECHMSTGILFGRSTGHLYPQQAKVSVSRGAHMYATKRCGELFYE